MRVTRAPALWAGEYQAHSWEWIVTSCHDLAAANAYFAPLDRFATELAESRYARGLAPVLAMHSIRLYQNERYSLLDPMVHVLFEEGEFVVRYHPGALSPPLAGTPATWERRGPDAWGMLEGCLRHLGWFIEYRPPHGPARDLAPPA